MTPPPNSTPGTGKFSWKVGASTGTDAVVSGPKVSARKLKKLIKAGEERPIAPSPLIPQVQGKETHGFVPLRPREERTPPSQGGTLEEGEVEEEGEGEGEEEAEGDGDGEDEGKEEEEEGEEEGEDEEGELKISGRSQDLHSDSNVAPSTPRRSPRKRSDGETGEEPDSTHSSSNGTPDMTKTGASFKKIRIHPNNAMDHQCDRCGKVYKHRNCLLKHAWEHHESWTLTKRWCQTKHQQVQMLEAAHVLVEMTAGFSEMGPPLTISSLALRQGQSKQEAT